MTPWERFFFWFALVNFVAFLLGAIALGGDAISGSSHDGHYYLSEHGVPTEVKQSVFQYSFIHTLSLFVTQPLGIVAALRSRSRARRRKSEVEHVSM